MTKTTLSTTPFDDDEVLRATMAAVEQLDVAKQHDLLKRLQRGLQLDDLVGNSVKDGGYSAALAVARIAADDLVEGKARQHGLIRSEIAVTAADLLAALSDAELERVGLAADEIRLVREGKVGQLPSSKGVALARALDVSAEWLAGVALHRGAAPDPNERFDPNAFEERRKERGVSRADVQAALRLDERRYRRLINGRFEPNLDEVLVMKRLIESRDRP